jgi:hypothetical protein
MPWTTAYHSGMSSDADMRGCIDSNSSIGVVAGLLTSQQLILTLPKYLDNGGEVFVDSGAFAAFRKNDPIRWDRVFHAYECLIDLSDNPQRLSIVAPDVVGDQGATIELWNKHSSRMRRWVAAGVRLIMPLQTGSLPASAVLEIAISVLGTKDFAAGIPSNLVAMPALECGNIFHHDFHILGRVALSEAIRNKVSRILHTNPQAKLTADANWLRSRIAKLSTVETSKPSKINEFSSRRSQAISSLLGLEKYQRGSPLQKDVQTL